MATHDCFGEVHAFGGERDLASGFDQAFALESFDHLADGGAADVHAFSDAGLDDIEVVFAEFVDRLAVLLERRVPFGGFVLAHVRTLVGCDGQRDRSCSVLIRG